MYNDMYCTSVLHDMYDIYINMYVCMYICHVCILYVCMYVVCIYMYVCEASCTCVHNESMKYIIRGTVYTKKLYVIRGVNKLKI